MFPYAFGWLDMYAVMIGIGIISCFVFLEIYYRKQKVRKLLISYFEILGTLAIGLGLLFAVLFQNLYDFIENPETYSWSWSMTFYGGLIGGVVLFLLGYFFVIRKKFGPQMRNLLTIAPACITIAHAFGRIGCFLSGCCYGIETDSPLGVLFPGHNHAVLPTNLFEAVFLFILSGTLLFLALKINFKYNMGVYLISYGIWRFIIEFFRDDHRGEFIPGLSPSQFWSIIMIVGGIAFFFIYHFVEKRIASKKEAQQEN